MRTTNSPSHKLTKWSKYSCCMAAWRSTLSGQYLFPSQVLPGSTCLVLVSTPAPYSTTTATQFSFRAWDGASSVAQGSGCVGRGRERVGAAHRTAGERCGDSRERDGDGATTTVPDARTTGRHAQNAHGRVRTNAAARYAQETGVVQDFLAATRSNLFDHRRDVLGSSIHA